MSTANITWILTANAGRARFFSQASASSALEEINDMLNAQVNLQTAETESDRIGQRAASKSIHSVGAPTQPSGYQPNPSPAEHQTEVFARDIADYLLRGYQDRHFQKLMLVASPQFLGVIRKLLHPDLISSVTLEINKDYTHLDKKELLEHLDEKSTSS